MENAESIRERSGIVFVILCELRDSVKKTGVRRLLPGKSAVIILRAAKTNGRVNLIVECVKRSATHHLGKA